MYFSKTKTIAFVALLSGVYGMPKSQSSNLSPSNYAKSDIIETDCVIIGGGATGTYSAIQLKDKGKHVIVIESKSRLGGHTETYHDPETGLTIDMGVKLYHNEPLVHQWYARFNLTLAPYNINFAGSSSQNIDFRTGQILEGIPAADQTALSDALQRYGAALQQWPQLDGGFFLPDPVPEDLYLPFSHFVQKYNISAAVPFIFSITSAFGDILELPAVQIIRTLSLSLLATTQSFLTSSVSDNSLLYERATAELSTAKSLFLSSRVLATHRVSQSGKVYVLVDTPKGYKFIIAKKILMTIPPNPSTLGPFDIGQNELNLFKQLTSVGYYTSIIKNVGPANVDLQNLALDQPDAMPPMPAVYNVAHTVNPTLSQVFYGTKIGQSLTDDEAKSAIMTNLNRYRAKNNITGPAPEFVAFSNHSPYNMMAGSNATKNGFYKQLYALQGARNMFWTGATWRAHDSSASWAYTNQTVLPGLLASL